MTDPAPDIRLPRDLLPADGRFGSGPSKVRPEQVAAVTDAGRRLLGTSHRQEPVRRVVRSVRHGLAALYGLPGEWEVVIGNGGTTTFWDAASFGLVARRSQHLSFGEFSAKFAGVVAAAPHLDEPQVIAAEPGTCPAPEATDGIDLYALTHNETSTGVMAPIRRPDRAGDALVAVDATSAAGGLRVDLGECDIYYFAPQKCLASDGGLWLALCSPAAVARIEQLAAARWIPPSLDLSIALENSRKDQTYNTPAIATLLMIDTQLNWMLDGGGLEFAASRSEESARVIYSWAEKRDFATPFVTDPAIRSSVVATIDLDESIDALAVAGVLRANGIVDTEPYRKLGRNQLRIALYPAIDPSDVEILTRAIDHVVERTTG